MFGLFGFKRDPHLEETVSQALDSNTDWSRINIKKKVYLCLKLEFLASITG